MANSFDFKQGRQGLTGRPGETGLAVNILSHFIPESALTPCFISFHFRVGKKLFETLKVLFESKGDQGAHGPTGMTGMIGPGGFQGKQLTKEDSNYKEAY